MIDAIIQEAEDGEFYVVFKSENGEPWMRSTEGYTERHNAQRSVLDFTARIKGGVNIINLDREGNRITRPFFGEQGG